jgi:hypothetical protein
MNEARTERLLRAAARDEAAAVTSASVPSFDQARLPVPRRPLLGSVALRGPLAPLLAAVAVVAVVALALTLSSVLTRAGHASRPATGNGAGPGRPTDAVPLTYVALTATGTPATGHPFTITVRSTITGKALATVAPPASLGTFSLVEGTANPDTFLVGAQPWHPVSGDNSAQPVTLFLLHYNPTLQPNPNPGPPAVQLTPVPLPPLTGAGLTSVAISPDGSRVAVADDSISKGVQTRTSITVYPLPGGAARTWSAPGSFKLSFKGREVSQPTNNIGALSWAADDRTLAVPLSGLHNGVYLLNTKDTGTASLLAASRLTVPLTGQRSNGDFLCDDDPRITANGADVLCGGYTIPAGWSTEAKGLPQGPVTQGFGEFSVATGKLVTILGAIRAPISLEGKSANPYQQSVTDDVFPFLLWTSQDAQVTIGLTDGGHAVLVRDGQTLRIPWPLSIAIPSGANAPGAAW